MKVSQLEEELAQALVVGWNYHLDMEREILFRGFYLTSEQLCLVQINKHCKVEHRAASVQAVMQEQILAIISALFLCYLDF